MTSLLSAISGQFGKTMVLGTFLPVVLFVVVDLVLVLPLLPADAALLEPVRALDAEWQLAAVLLAALLLTGLLYNLNVPLVRLYEGYPWRDSAVGRRCTERQLRQLARLRERMDGLGPLLDALRTADPPAPPETVRRLRSWQGDLARALEQEYPAAGLVLPTRLGNVIRAFEEYPRRRYGMSAIPLWPRLTAVVEKDYAASIDGARMSFDFTINLSVLSGASALLALVAGLAWPGRVGGEVAEWLLTVLVLGTAAAAFYHVSVGRAQAWGDTVKGAFDLYRWELLGKLGYAAKPRTPAEERALWERISKQLIFGDPPPGLGLPAPYAPPPPPPLPRVEVRQGPVPVLTRGVTPGPEGEITVTLAVRNADAARAAADVRVTEALPGGFAYVWGSASGTAAEPEGAGPYHFFLGELRPGARALVTYRAVPLRQPGRGAATPRSGGDA